MEISKEARSILLKAARDSIQSVFDNKEIPEPKLDKHPVLNQCKGAFVTLTKHGELRGCIGYIDPQLPLYKVVSQVARQAAFSDPRFPSLNKNELDSVLIEISVLLTFTKINSYDEIEIGKHGLLLEEGAKGLLLPQVALDHKFDKEQFLSAVCRKAGLYSEYWKERVLNMSVFTAEIFSEVERKNQ